jgi:hypothetical protein
MSIYSKLLSVAIATTLFSGILATSAQTTGLLSAPLSNSSFTYCNWNNYIATSDVEAARQVIGTSAYFYVTENTSNNVVNGKCVNNLVANYVPYISGHTTTFDLTNAGAITNVKLRNTSPYLSSVECDGESTVVKFKDDNQNYLTYNTIIGDSNNYDITSSQESNNTLKVTLKRKDYSFNGTNKVTLYINETLPTTATAGYQNMKANVSVTSYTPSNVTIDKPATTIKQEVAISGICNTSNYSSSIPAVVSSSSSSKAVESKTTSSSSQDKIVVTVSSTQNVIVEEFVLIGGKGILTRTGGSN